MIRITSHVECLPRQTTYEVSGGHRAWRTNYIGFSPSHPERGQAWLLEGSPQRSLRPHYHEVDQFQIVAGGEGLLGKHRVGYGAVHFSRAYTPYGPVVWGDKGMQLITLRPKPDPMSKPYFMPECKEQLRKISRKPFQIAALANFVQNDSDVHLEAVPGIQDEAGLAAHSLVLKPGAKTTAPDPSRSGGQFILVMKGSLLHDGKPYPAFSVAEVTADEKPFSVVAGSEGLEALVVSFSRPDAQGANSHNLVRTAPASRKWVCEPCGRIYDEALGMPDEGIAPGTRWEDVPADWACPDCAATKADFRLLEQ